VGQTAAQLSASFKGTPQAAAFEAMEGPQSGYTPTSGFTGLLMAINVCAKVRACAHPPVSYTLRYAYPTPPGHVGRVVSLPSARLAATIVIAPTAPSANQRAVRSPPNLSRMSCASADYGAW
jgi:hypothetical protein